MVVLLYLISKQLGGLEGRQLVRALWRMGLGCLAMLVGLAGTSMALGTASPWLISAISIILGGVIYGLVTLLLGSQEPMALMRAIRSRARI